MVTIKIKLKPISLQSQDQTVYYLLNHDNESAIIISPYVLHPEEWYEINRHIFLSNNCRPEYAKKIKEELSFLKQLTHKLNETSSGYTLQDLAQAYNEYIAVSEEFFSFMEKLILYLKEIGKWGTAQNYSRARKSLINFLKGNQLPFSAITSELMLNYEQWLMKRGVMRNTSSFYMRQLRSVYNNAVNKGITVQNYPFSKVYTGVDKTKKRALDEGLVKELRTIDLSHDSSLSFARDLFLFSLYMRGIAFVDMAYLKKSNIRNGFIYYVRHKTGSLLQVRLEPCMIKIINKYSAKTNNTEYLLPILTETDELKTYKQYQNRLSYYNKLLKRLSGMLKLDQPLTSYVARHTWATVARNINIPLPIISQSMGHSSEMTTRIYLASLDENIIDKANQAIISVLTSKKKEYKTIGGYTIEK